jgi:hypothetical protein
MNEEIRLSLADFYYIGTNLLWISLKAQMAMQTKEQFKVRGENSLVGALEVTNSILKDYNIAPQVQKEIQNWIDGLNRAYIQAETPPLFAINYYLNFNDVKEIEKATERWRETIINSLANDFYKPCKIETALIDKSKLLSGLNSFLSGDVLKHLSASSITDLNDATKCIVLGLPTPAAMITFRASEDILRLYYEKKTQNSSAGKRWSDIINELLKVNDIKKPLVDYLNYIRIKRNEAEHPDKFFTQRECEHAFMQVIDLITEVSKDCNFA